MKNKIVDLSNGVKNEYFQGLSSNMLKKIPRPNFSGSVAPIVQSESPGLGSLPTKEGVLKELTVLKKKRQKLLVDHERKVNEARKSNKPLELSGGHQVALNSIDKQIQSLEFRLAHWGNINVSSDGSVFNLSRKVDTNVGRMPQTPTIKTEDDFSMMPDPGITNQTSDKLADALNNSLVSDLTSKKMVTVENSTTKESSFGYIGLIIAVVVLFIILNTDSY